MVLTDVFTPAAIASYWNEVASNQIPYLGTALFPAKKKAGLDLTWIRGTKGLPVSLMPSAFDAKATFRDRPGLTINETEMPFFREGFKVKERDRQEILRVRESNDPYVNDVLNRLYDDAATLLEGANVVPERMAMQLLFAEDGDVGITIKANGTNYTYNYDPNGDWKASNYFALSGNSLWTAPTTSNPFKDFKTAKDAIVAKTGVAPTLAVMNSTTFNLMAQSETIKNRFLTTIGTTVGFISDVEVVRVVESVSGISPVVYDKLYKDEDGVAHNFVPDGYVALVPDGALGNTYYGTTPEEADLVGGNSDAQVAIVNTGVAITQILDSHPVNLNTFASEIVLPSYERMDEVALIKVIA